MTLINFEKNCDVFLFEKEKLEAACLATMSQSSSLSPFGNADKYQGRNLIVRGKFVSNLFLFFSRLGADQKRFAAQKNVFVR